MYGIFKATAELRNYPKTAWDIVSADTEIRGAVELFDSLEDAKSALSKYTTTIDKNVYVTTVYNCECYFVAEAELFDEDDGYIGNNVLAGDGIDITPIE